MKYNEISENKNQNSIKIKASGDVLCQEIDNELVILNLKDERYLGLDESGTIFWRALMETDSLEDAFNRLQDEFDVKPSVLLKDMNDLITELKDNGLIEISEV